MLSQRLRSLNPKLGDLGHIFKLGDLGHITKLRIFGDSSFLLWEIEENREHRFDLEALSVVEVGESR